jgi:hypothetical protein
VEKAATRFSNGGPQAVLAYLSRYTHRVAIANSAACLTAPVRLLVPGSRRTVSSFGVTDHSIGVRQALMQNICSEKFDMPERIAPKYHPTPMSGGDRKALAKELGKARAMANILASQSAEMRAKGEPMIQQADKLACESWNERTWSDGFV